MREENCFVARAATKHSGENASNFNAENAERFGATFPIAHRLAAKPGELADDQALSPAGENR